MTRRADRRRYAILGVLAEQHGPVTVDVIERCLRLAPGTLYPDLVVLLHDNRIKRVSGGSLTDRTTYRLATPAEFWEPAHDGRGKQ